MATKHTAARRRIDLRISPEVAALLDEEAAREHRTLNAHIGYLLERHIDGQADRSAVVRKERHGLAVRDHTRQVLEQRG